MSYSKVCVGFGYSGVGNTFIGLLLEPLGFDVVEAFSFGDHKPGVVRVIPITSKESFLAALAEKETYKHLTDSDIFIFVVNGVSKECYCDLASLVISHNYNTPLYIPKVDAGLLSGGPDLLLERCGGQEGLVDALRQMYDVVKASVKISNARFRVIDEIRLIALWGGLSGQHDYLPKTSKEAEGWQPHDWVIRMASVYAQKILNLENEVLDLRGELSKVKSEKEKGKGAERL